MSAPYFVRVGEVWQDRVSGAAACPRHTLGLTQLHSYLSDIRYPCIGARAAVKRDALCGQVYPGMADSSSVAALHEALTLFADDLKRCQHNFMTFAALFEGPELASEVHFERVLWEHLQALHDYDAPRNAWDPAVASDPESPSFSFSIAGCAWFIVGLHPHASRQSRRFSMPALIFNAHSQFNALRQLGNYGPMQVAVRSREIAYSGSVNPVLSDFGTQSDARQYSGVNVDADWKCPLIVREPR